jgi:Tfp pilus assembly PilM family ATPase
MASSKKIGFYCSEEKVTLVEFDKNSPTQVVNSSLSSKSSASSPFSSSLTEEIQITSILQKILQENKITSTSFYVSLPMKEIILRSFIIPFVKQEDIQNAIKFESKKYMPFDIQDLTFVYHTIPFSEGQNKRLQVIFFAVRKEVLARYDRIFKQVNAEVAYCEPYMVSLSKTLLFQKEIKPTDHLAFLNLDKNLGRICFIDKGIPQFIREFPVKPVAQHEDVSESNESLNLRIVNEVANSFDFYARQFSGDRIEQMLVASDLVQPDLLGILETELKVKITKYTPVITTLSTSQSNDMDAIYAMGACVTPSLDSLSNFNFLGSKKTKPGFEGGFSPLKNSIEIVFVLLICLAVLVGCFVFFQIHLKIAQSQYDQLVAKQGASKDTTIEFIQGEMQQSSDLLAKYKNIRIKSDVASIVVRIASHLPQGALLSDLTISYGTDDPNSNKASVVIEMRGNVYKEDPNEEIAEVEKIYSDFKEDKELAQFVTKVNLVSLNRQMIGARQLTQFIINCS